MRKIFPGHCRIHINYVLSHPLLKNRNHIKIVNNNLYHACTCPHVCAGLWRECQSSHQTSRMQNRNLHSQTGRDFKLAHFLQNFQKLRWRSIYLNLRTRTFFYMRWRWNKSCICKQIRLCRIAVDGRHFCGNRCRCIHEVTNQTLPKQVWLVNVSSSGLYFTNIIDKKQTIIK